MSGEQNALNTPSDIIEIADEPADEELQRVSGRVDAVMNLTPVELNQYLHQLLAGVKIQFKDRQLYIEV
jgi:hypothetical protein